MVGKLKKKIHSIGTMLYRSIIYLSFLLQCVSCNKEQPLLVLDQNYLMGADVLQYCQGPCDEASVWENKNALVKGCIKDVESESKMEEYFSESKFYLQDIRNGMYLEVRIPENKEAIFEKIFAADKSDTFRIKGTLNPVLAMDGVNCIKGVVLILNHPDDIDIE